MLDSQHWDQIRVFRVLVMTCMAGALQICTHAAYLHSIRQMCAHQPVTHMIEMVQNCMWRCDASGSGYHGVAGQAQMSKAIGSDPCCDVPVCSVPVASTPLGND